MVWSGGYGGDSCSEGRDFESWHSILDGHDIFHIYFVVKNVLMFAWKRSKRQRKEARDGLFLKNSSSLHVNCLARVAHHKRLISCSLEGARRLMNGSTKNTKTFQCSSHIEECPFWIIVPVAVQIWVLYDTVIQMPILIHMAYLLSLYVQLILRWIKTISKIT